MMRQLPALALCLLVAPQDPGRDPGRLRPQDPARDPAAVEQDPAAGTGRALHRGWLREILDGDYRGAARLYGQAADDDSLPTPLRAFAAARAVEILRVDSNADPDALEAGLPRLGRLMRSSGYDMSRARGFGAAGSPLAADDLAEAARGGLSGFDAWLTARRQRRAPPLNPRLFTPDLHRYLIEELERSRLSGNESSDRSYWQQITQRRSGRSFRLATEILKLFLEGNERRAFWLRRQISRDLRREVPMPPDPVAALATAQRRLDQEMARVDLNPADREALRALAVHLRQLGPERVEEAVSFVRRLPVYGELLLGER